MIHKILYNLKTKKEKEEADVELEGIPLKVTEILSPNELFFDLHAVALDQTLIRSFVMKSLPSVVPLLWVKALIPPYVDSRFSIKIKPITDVEAKNLFKRLQYDLKSGEELQRKILKNPEYEDTEVQKVLQELKAREMQMAYQKGTEKNWWVKIILTFLIPWQETFELTADTMDSTVEKFFSEVQGTGFLPEGMFGRELEGFLYNMPFSPEEPPKTIKFLGDTSFIAYSLLFGSADINHPEGIEFGINMNTGGIIRIDTWSLPNPHIAVFGKSGSGKSSFAKAISLRELFEKDIPLRIIDPTGEYEEIGNMFGADIIKFTLKGSKVYYNPFKFEYMPVSREDDPFNEKVVFIADLVNLLCGEILSPEQVALLHSIIEEVYKEKGIIKGEFDTYRNPPPEMENLIFLLQTKAGDPTIQSRWGRSKMQSIADLLSDWGRNGPYGEFFNRTDQNRREIDLNKPFIIFDISEMEEQFKKVGFMLILHLIRQEVLKEKKQRRLLLDEGWRIIHESEVAKKFLHQVLLARKQGLGITIVTTDVEHFLDDNIGSSILNQMSTIATFMVEPNEVAKVKEVFKLTDAEADKIKVSKSQRGYYLLKLPSLRLWGYNQLSPIEMNLFKTNITEVL